jgi:hypothetical protein
MSSLIPQKRPDKNGKLVTRHVRADLPAPSGAGSIPAPQLSPLTRSAGEGLSRRSIQELMEGIGRSLSKADASMTYDTMELLEGTKAVEPRRSLLEAMYEATDGIDSAGAKMLMSGFEIYRHTTQARNASCLELSARAYRFARRVEDAMPDSPDGFDNYVFARKLGLFAKDFFPNDISYGSDPDDVVDLEGAYLLGRLYLNAPSKFNTEGAYYRALRKVRDRFDELEGVLPLLLAARSLDDKSHDSLDAIFALAKELSEVCPAEKSRSIAGIIMERGEFSVDLVKQLADLDATSLSSGVL